MLKYKIFLRATSPNIKNLNHLVGFVDKNCLGFACARLKLKAVAGMFRFIGAE